MFADQSAPTESRAAVEERASIGPSELLCLAATPTFAFMALQTKLSGNGLSSSICSATEASSPLVGMAAMYVLMSLFHLTPWLRLFSGRPNGVKRP